MKHSTKLGLIIAIALFSAILEFGFGLALVAQIIITVTGTLIALSMLKEMIKTLRSGSYGVDLLAITAVAGHTCCRSVLGCDDRLDHVGRR